MTNILILGKSSQLGQTISLYEKKLINSKLFFLDIRSFDFKNYDLLNQNLNSFNFDILINFIAFTKVDEAENNIKESFDLNVLLPSNILRYMNEKKKNFYSFFNRLCF
tara:strand:- start:155 stop:478 length:324 start_codon:yes stop_codon:yes gene_type:complete